MIACHVVADFGTPENACLPFLAFKLNHDAHLAASHRGGRLRFLVAHAGKVLTHKFIFREVWGTETDVQYLRINIRTLRQRLEGNPEQPALIFTERGAGCRLNFVMLDAVKQWAGCDIAPHAHKDCRSAMAS